MNWINVTDNVVVKRLLKERADIERRIKAIDKNALVAYDLELLNIPVPVRKWMFKSFGHGEFCENEIEGIDRRSAIANFKTSHPSHKWYDLNEIID